MKDIDSPSLWSVFGKEGQQNIVSEIVQTISINGISFTIKELPHNFFLFTSSCLKDDSFSQKQNENVYFKYWLKKPLKTI